MYLAAGLGCGGGAFGLAGFGGCGLGFGFGFGLWGFGGYGLINPWVAALAVQPTVSMLPAGFNPFAPVVGPSIQGIAETAILPFQAVKRLANGHLAAATGNDIFAGDLVIGVSAGNYAIGQMATAAKDGATITTPMSVFGNLFRDANGMPVLFNVLPVVAPSSGGPTYTNGLGVASAAGFDVQIFQSEPIV